jgi:hypothetical protein
MILNRLKKIAIREWNPAYDVRYWPVAAIQGRFDKSPQPLFTSSQRENKISASTAEGRVQKKRGVAAGGPQLP